MKTSDDVRLNTPPWNPITITTANSHAHLSRNSVTKDKAGSLQRYFIIRNELPMICTLQRHPATDFMSEQAFDATNDRGSTSPQQRRQESFPVPVRAAHPSREPSKEDIELAQHLVGHSRGIRDTRQNQEEQDVSPSPTYEPQNQDPNLTPRSERMRQLTPRSASLERMQRESSQAYAPVTSSQSDSVLSGQVCR